MKKFKFNLEPLLNYKSQQENLLMNDLSQCQDAISKIENNIVKITREKNSQVEKLEKELSKQHKISQIRSFYTYLERIECNLAGLTKQLNQEKDTLAEIIAKLREKNKERKVLDKLKDKSFTQYKEELKLEEYKQSDQRNSFNHYNED